MDRNCQPNPVDITFSVDQFDMAEFAIIRAILDENKFELYFVRICVFRIQTIAEIEIFESFLEISGISHCRFKILKGDKNCGKHIICNW